MTREEADFIGGMNMCDEISNEAYKKIMCHCEVQEPKTGQWIISQNDCFVNCSECGLHGDKGIYKHYRWCPHCGAKMQEREG